jgi:tetratricopeptide (TPR) repeat protein
MTILEASGDSSRGPTTLRWLYIKDLSMLTAIELDASALAEAAQNAARATAAARAWTKSTPAEPSARKALLNALDRQGQVLEAAGKRAEAKQVLEEAIGVADALQIEQPSDVKVAEDAADARLDLALTLQVMGDGAEALSRVREGEAILDRLIAGAPENKSWRGSRIQLTSTRSQLILATAHGDDAVTEQAIAVQREAATMARSAAAANPRDLEVLDMAAVMAARLANRLNGAKHLEELLVVEREAMGIIDQMLAIEPESRRYLYLRANAGVIVGDKLARAGRWREAREALLEGERFSKRAMAKGSQSIRLLQNHTSVLLWLTRSERNLGSLETAKERCREAMTATEELIRINKDAKDPAPQIDILREEAKLLGIPDTTLGRQK